MAYKQGPVQGTWTPSIDGLTSPTVTYTTQLGSYTQVGAVVFARAIITINTISGGSGAIRFSLPFTTSSDSINTIGCALTTNVAYPASTGYISASVDSGLSYCFIRSTINDAAISDCQISGLANGDTIIINLQYWT